jgi:hypothetical protein
MATEYTVDNPTTVPRQARAVLDNSIVLTPGRTTVQDLRLFVQTLEREARDFISEGVPVDAELRVDGSLGNGAFTVRGFTASWTEPR